MKYYIRKGSLYYYNDLVDCKESHDDHEGCVDHASLYVCGSLMYYFHEVDSTMITEADDE